MEVFIVQLARSSDENTDKNQIVSLSFSDAVSMKRFMFAVIQPVINNLQFGTNLAHSVCEPLRRKNRVTGKEILFYRQFAIVWFCQVCQISPGRVHELRRDFHGVSGSRNTCTGLFYYKQSVLYNQHFNDRLSLRKHLFVYQLAS